MTRDYQQELEQKIIGIILKDNKKMDLVLENITSNMFINQQHKNIFNVMLDLYYNNRNINIKVIKANYNNIDISYLLSVFGSVVSTSTIESDVYELKNIYNRKLIFEKAKYITDNIKNANISNLDMLADMEEFIKTIDLENNMKISNIMDAHNELVDDLASRKDRIVDIKTGFPILDKTIYGLQPKEIYIIGARPGQGKSAFALNIIDNIIKQGKNVTLLSLEMSKKQLYARLLSKNTSIPLSTLNLADEFNTDEWGLINEYKSSHKNNGNLTIIDSHFGSMVNIKNNIKALHKQGKCDVLFIDYIQLINTNNYRGNRVQEVSFISRTLKEMAMDLSIPIVGLAQLNRSTEQEKRPKLSNLRESGKNFADETLFQFTAGVFA